MKLANRYDLWIGGHAVRAGKYAPVVTPYDGATFAEAAFAGVAELGAAISAAANRRKDAAITPFNFHLNLVCHKVGPAIASGNTVVLKPATNTPISAYLLAELLAEAGLPAGFLNVVSGPGGTLGDALAQNGDVAMVSFTGSVAVGRRIRELAGLKPVTLELGNNGAVIIDEGVDPQEAAERVGRATVRPTVLADVPPDARISREEAFGPGPVSLCAAPVRRTQINARGASNEFSRDLKCT